MPTLRTGFAVARAIAAAALGQLVRRPPASPPAVEPPRRLAFPSTASIEIAARPEEIFAVLATPARMADWLVLHTGWAADPPGELAVGARFRQRVTLMGMPSEVRWTVAGVEAPQTVWLDGTGPMGIVVGLYLLLTPTATGTVVRYDGGVEGGSAQGPVGAMVARNLTDVMHKSLTRLGQLVTASPAAASEPGRPAASAPGASEPGRPAASAPRPVSPERVKPAPIRHRRTGRAIDAWTPVIVGVGQVSEHSTEPTGGDPVSLAVRALREAARDSGAGDRLLSAADSVGYVASVSWQYPDGAALIAEAVGARPAETVQTTMFGGDGSLRLINDAAAAIAGGHISIALLGGGEAAATAAAAEKAGRPAPWPVQPHGTAPSRTIGLDSAPNSEAEIAVGLVAPIYLYALIESAVRARHGRAPAEHLAWISELWAQFSEVAAANPHAWLPEPHTAAELATPSADNRPISAPYSKLLTANLQVNQATGIIVCSAEAAQQAGIAQDRWVFAHAGAHATDEWHVTERDDLASSPAIHAVGAAVLEHAGVSLDDVRHLDLYACFPCAVEIAATELGLPIDAARPLTVTGGLTFAGGPGNNYTSHAVVNLVHRLRADPDGFGLATALGWYLTKHTAGLFSAQPPGRGYRDIDADLTLVRPDARKVDRDYTGPAVLEAYTVPYSRDGEPTAGIVTALTPSGDRVVRRIGDRVLIDRLLAEDPLGRRLHVTADGLSIVDSSGT